MAPKLFSLTLQSLATLPSVTFPFALPPANLAAYIQFLAASNDYLSYAGMAPIMRGWYPPSSSGVHVLRLVMWTLTTPFMVYLLSKLSDFGRDKVGCASGDSRSSRGR